MDNKNKDFDLEESPIGIKPLEDDDSQEVKLVRTQQIPITKIEEPIDMPIEKKEVRPIRPIREVRIVPTVNEQLDEPVDSVSMEENQEPKLTDNEVEETPIIPDDPAIDKEAEEPKKEKKEIKKRDIIMYIIMAIIIIVIILLGINYCQKRLEDERRMVSLKKTTTTTTSSTTPTTKTDATLTTTTTEKSTDKTGKTTTTSKKTDSQGYTGTTAPTTQAGDITKTYKIEASKISLTNKKNGYTYTLPNTSVTVKVIGKKAAVDKVGTPKLKIDVGNMKVGTNKGTVQINGTYSGVKFVFDPTTLNVTVKESATTTTTTTTEKVEDVYTYSIEDGGFIPVYYIQIFKNGNAYNGAVRLYTSATASEDFARGTSNHAAQGVTVSKAKYDLSGKPTLYFSIESECEAEDKCSAKRYKMQCRS